MPTLPVRARTLCLLVGLTLLAGCGTSETVQTYTVKKDAEVLPSDVGLGKTATEPVTPPVAGAIRSRTLGVIIPVNATSSRYIKFAGPVEKVTAQEVAFEAFVKSVRFEDVGKAPTYTVPEGWTLNPPRQFVPVSFTVAAGTPQVTLSDEINGSLLENVNRWRKEVGLPAVTEADLGTSIVETTLGAVKAFRVDLRGPTAPGGGGMRGPFQGKS